MTQSKIVDAGFIVILLLVAGGLIALAGPRLYAHGRTISAEHILWNINQGTLQPGASQVDRGRTAFLESSTLGVDSSYFLIREGASLITQLNSVEEAHLPQSLSALRKTYTSALSLRPMYGPAWPRLAMVSLRQETDPAELIKFLTAAYIVGPQDFRLRVMRVWVALRMWKDLGEDLKRNVRHDVQILWGPRRRNDLADLYFRSTFSQRILLRSLMASEDDAKNLGRLTQRLLDLGRL